MNARIPLMLLFTAFTAMAVFGLTPMGEGMNHQAPDCLASALSMNFCNQTRDPLASIAFHLNAFQSFSLAPLFAVTALPLLVALAAASATVLALLHARAYDAARVSYLGFKRYGEPLRFRTLRRAIRWIVLQEHGAGDSTPWVYARAGTRLRVSST